MSKTWPLTFLFIGFFFQAALKTQEVRSLSPFFKADPVIKLSYFSAHQAQLSLEDRELLKLWESLLTGRAGPISRWMKDRYKLLGLNHIFTPSGFHLSAVLWPMKLFLKNQRHQLLLYLLLGLSFFFLSGLSAMKRMIKIKISQNVFGFKLGFILAIVCDIIWGTFQNSPLGMTYSLMFLGIIYSGRTGLILAFWIFMAQMMIAYFQGSFISLLLIILNPLLSLVFGLIMPVLLILSWPLNEWQLSTGLFLLRGTQSLIDISAYIVGWFPQFEVHLGILLILIPLSLRRWKSLGLALLLITGSLNLDLQNSPTIGQNEFYPKENFLYSVTTKKGLKAYYEDGSCENILRRGQWFERCSPKKRSTSKIMKLSFL